jgi:hypothetical protein
MGPPLALVHPQLAPMSAHLTKPVVAGMTPSLLPVKARRIVLSPHQAAPARTGRCHGRIVLFGFLS